MNRTSVLTLISAIFLMLLLSACGGGGTSPVSNSVVASGPTAAISANSAVKAANGQTFLAAVGSQITLNGTSSTGSISAYAWTLTAKPLGSSTALSSSTGGIVNLVPDVSGNYTVTLTVTDTNGMSSAQSMTVQVTSSIPVVNVVDTLQFSGSSTTVATQYISVGNVVTLDASGSTDPAKQQLVITWTMLQQPAGSAASLVQGSAVTHFSPDVAGQYQVRARATNASGAYSDVIAVFVANNPPTAAVVTNATPVSGTGSIASFTGYQIVLDSSSSKFPATDTVVANWSMLSVPSGSKTAQLSAATGVSVNFVPDVPGAYVVQLLLQDSTTKAAAQYNMTVNVAQAPVAVVTGSSAPVAVASAPTFVGQSGVPFTLRGSGSYDPNGASLTYAWVLTGKPTSSKVVISNPAAQNLVFTPDVNGAYTFTLTVSDINGVCSSQPVTVNVGGYPPVAVVAQPQIGILLGATVSDSAAQSYDQDGNSLSYAWSIDAAPSGSTAKIANPNLATLSFTPDVAGTYTATVTVSDGNFSSLASVAISVVSAQPSTVPLSYLPLNVKFDKALGKAIIVSTNPNVLHIVDPVAATDISVPLPAAVKSLGLSPNGTYAGVLHEGTVSLVNLSTATLVHTSITGGSQTDVFVNNSGQFYLTGQTGGQWVNPDFTKLDGTTGATLQTANAGSVYGTTLGIYSDLNNKIFVLSLGLSPSQIYAVNLDSNGNIATTTGSPYWGTYSMNTPLWLSADQSLLYTSAGTYFKTADLTYQGTLGLTGAALSLSNSATAQETVLLQGVINYANSTVTYPSVYKRYTGSLQLAQPDVTLPVVGGLQTYGLYIFHASDDTHVMVVQTGGSANNATGLQYYLLKR
jgi:hypothetical protein